LIISARTGNLAALAACASLMGYALYAQEVLALDPCPLCILQRVAVIVMGLLFLAAGMHNPGRIGGRVYALLLAAAALLGAAVAGRHVWLQYLPPDKVPACGPGLNYMLEAFPLTEVLKLVLSGSGECAEFKWSFLGLSMPAWVLIVLLLMGGFGWMLNWFGKLAVASLAER
jgi:disulfide bond formation protein DsbB